MMQRAAPDAQTANGVLRTVSLLHGHMSATGAHYVVLTASTTHTLQLHR